MSNYKYETHKGMPNLLKEGTDTDKIMWAIYNEMVSGYRVPVEDTKTVMALRDAKARGYSEMFRAIYRAKRAERLAYLTMTQRQWQRKTHRPSRARHHDSIAIREKYVRCA